MSDAVESALSGLVATHPREYGEAIASGDAEFWFEGAASSEPDIRPAWKFLSVDGASCFGGAKMRWEPCEWVEERAFPVPCRKGLHLVNRTSDLMFWLGPALWEAEFDAAWGAVLSSRKIAASRARVVRRVEAYEPSAPREFAAWCVMDAASQCCDAVTADMIAWALADGGAKVAERVDELDRFWRERLKKRLCDGVAATGTLVSAVWDISIGRYVAVPPAARSSLCISARGAPSRDDCEARQVMHFAATYLGGE